MAWQDRDYYREGGDFRLRFGFEKPPPMTLAVLAAMLAIYLVEGLSGGFVVVHGGPVKEWGALDLRGGLWWMQPWRWLTYPYIHGGPGHIFFNMLGAYFFLSPLERHWGWRRALAFFTMGGIAAGLAFAALRGLFPERAASLIGASGSVLASLGACAYLFPEMRVFLVIPIRVLAVILALLYVLTVVGRSDFSDAAHLGGLAFGVLGPHLGGPMVAGYLRRWRAAAEQREAQSLRREREIIDAILAKVSREGMHSLTRSERKALVRASERERRREMRRRGRLD